MEVKRDMKIERKIETKIVEQTVTKNIVQLSANDVTDIIKGHIKNQGYDTIKVNFDVGSRYITDDWGMNGHTYHYFSGATAEVEVPKGQS